MHIYIYAFDKHTYICMCIYERKSERERKIIVHFEFMFEGQNNSNELIKHMNSFGSKFPPSAQEFQELRERQRAPWTKCLLWKSSNMYSDSPVLKEDVVAGMCNLTLQ